jgi:NADH:ubiquinone oxidoreductase subunit K
MLDAAMVGAVGLVGIGLYGLLVSRNLIKLLIALQLAGKGAVLALVTAGGLSGKPALGESFALTVIVADTVAAAVGLALAVQVKRQRGTLDVRALSRSRRG